MKSITIILTFFILLPNYLFSQSSGTGFLISEDGHIVTNYHVVEGQDNITVTGINGNFAKNYSTNLISSDKNNDLAILKIDENVNLSISYSISWNSHDVGTEVFTLGYPLRSTMGDEIKLTNGIISSKSGYKGDISTYQTTTPVQSGNSGSPLFDNEGFIIGIISSIHTQAENAGYAIKTNYLKKLIESVPYKIDTPEFPLPNPISNLSLSEQVKLFKKNIIIVEGERNRTSPSTFEDPFIAETKSRANIKNKPDVLGDIISHIPQNTSVKIIGRENNYWKVFYNGQIGYSSEVFFKETSETFFIKESENIAQMPQKFRNDFEVATTKKRAKFRDEPNVLGDFIRTIPKGEVIYVVGFTDSYWKIYYDGSIGYLLDGIYFDVSYEMMRFKN